MSTSTIKRLEAIRNWMQSVQIAALIIPSSDDHQSEYVAEHWKVREWVSGFTGSAGTVVITADFAGLWTDSRYFLQAETELAGSGIQLVKQGVPHAPEHIEWLVDQLSTGDQIGFDGAQLSVAQVFALKKAIVKAGKDIQVTPKENLWTTLWADRPILPIAPVFAHDDHYVGQSAASKLEQLQAFCQKKKVSKYLVSSLDDIAWLLNLRGADVECNPLFYSFLVWSEEQSVLYVNPDKIPDSLRAQLEEVQIQIKDYQTVWKGLEQWVGEKERVGYDPGTTPFLLYESLWTTQWEAVGNPIREWKAIKNETEIGHIRTAMRKDGVALTRLFRWLEAVVATHPPTEAQVARKLDQLRAEQGGYYGESFAAIVGYQSNGAIIHYRAPEEGSATLAPKGILLLDSGGQYDEGTTDITRTVALGPVTEAQKKHFTLVLKGHIALDRAKFPVGTTGVQLDGFARYALWQERLNYGHGTGHGVGFFLNVHEPPQGFATSITTSRGSTAFRPGMLTSNEPGYYETGAYGIRIENLILCREAGDAGFGDFLEFETLTLFPIDRTLIDRSLLTKEEIAWLNRYHELVFLQLADHLGEEEQEWLKAQCKAL